MKVRRALMVEQEEYRMVWYKDHRERLRRGHDRVEPGRRKKRRKRGGGYNGTCPTTVLGSSSTIKSYGFRP